MSEPTVAQSGLRPDTIAVRGGLARSNFDETAEALYLTSGFVYESAEQAEAAFKDEVDHFIYSRYGNPTVTMFEERLRRARGGGGLLRHGLRACRRSSWRSPPCWARVTGSSSSRGLFGSCFVILDEILPRWGVETVFVDGPDLDQWREALSEPTQAVFFETPSNPMQELVDMRAVSDLAHAAGAQVVVDNVFGTPVFSKPLRARRRRRRLLRHQAHRRPGPHPRRRGAGDAEFIDGPVKNLMRHTGPSMSPFNAWVLVKGLETLSLRVEKQAANALAVARGPRGAPPGDEGRSTPGWSRTRSTSWPAGRCSAAAPS